MPDSFEIDAGLAPRRGVDRDSPREGADEALRPHRDRYGAAADIYLREVRPRSLAGVVVDKPSSRRRGSSGGSPARRGQVGHPSSAMAGIDVGGC
jgi:hypothetical protein